jgi:hypothetical protein
MREDLYIRLEFGLEAFTRRTILLLEPTKVNLNRCISKYI